MTVTVAGVTYTPVGQKDLSVFQRDIDQLLHLTSFNVDDFAIIASNMMSENLTFSTWPDLEREIRIREIGYQAEAYARKLVREHRPKYEKLSKELNDAKAFDSLDERDALESKAMEEHGVIRYCKPSYIKYECAARQVFQWFTGQREEDPLQMNCWEGVLYALVKTGAVDKTYIGWCNSSYPFYHPDIPDNVVTQLIANCLNNMDYLFWPPKRAYNFSEEHRNKVIPHDKKFDNFTRHIIPESLVIPRGRIVMFGAAAHVGISTGRSRPIAKEDIAKSLGRRLGHEMIEIDYGTGTFQEATIEDASEHYASEPLIIAPFPICPAPGSVDVYGVPTVTSESVKQAATQELTPLMENEKAKRTTEGNQFIKKLEEKLSVARNNKDEKAEKQIQNQITTRQKANAKALDDITKKYQGMILARVSKWNTEQQKLRDARKAKGQKLAGQAYEKITISYNANDPYCKTVKFPTPMWVLKKVQ